MTSSSTNKPLILITGSNGQLGMEFQKLSNAFPQFEYIFTSRSDFDISKSQSVADFLEKTRPQYLINCAAYTAVDKAEEEREAAYEINAKAVEKLAKQSATFNTKFIHFSTDYVFDGKKRSLYHVNDSISPQTVYGASKAEGEKLALNVNPQSLIIRTSWVYSSFGKNFVKTMLRLMNEKNEIGVVNDQYGSPTYALDLAEMVMQLLVDVENKKLEWCPGIYHYSNAGVISWFQFANAIKELSGSNCNVLPIKTAQFPTAAKRPAYSALDCTKLSLNYGVSQKPWRESLELCLRELA